MASDTFVGQLNGIDAFIGIVSDGNNVAAYVCDGANNTIGSDFHGTVDQASDGVLTLEAPNGTVLALNFDATTLPGMLVPDADITGAVTTTDGNTYTFDTEAAFRPAGIFLVADSQTLPDGSVADGGWVVLNSGEVRGRTPMPSSAGSGSGNTVTLGHSGSFPSLSSGHGSGSSSHGSSSSRGGSITFANTTTTIATTTTTALTTTTTTPVAVTTTQATTFTQNISRVFMSGGGTLPLPSFGSSPSSGGAGVHVGPPRFTA